MYTGAATARMSSVRGFMPPHCESCRVCPWNPDLFSRVRVLVLFIEENYSPHFHKCQFCSELTFPSTTAYPAPGGHGRLRCCLRNSQVDFQYKCFQGHVSELGVGILSAFLVKPLCPFVPVFIKETFLLKARWCRWLPRAELERSSALGKSLPGSCVKLGR